MSSEAKRTLAWESIGRILAALALWCTLFFPNAPGWRVAAHPAFHAATGVFTLWSAVLLCLGLRRRLALPWWVMAAPFVDGVALVALIHFTGGGTSPFLPLTVLYALAAYLAHAGRTALIGIGWLIVCLGLWGGVVLRFFPAPPAFHVLGEPYLAPLTENLVFLFTMAGAVSLLVWVASSLLVLYATRSRRLARRLTDARRELEAANGQLAATFHRLEQLSSAALRTPDRPGPRPVSARDDGPPAYKH